MIPEIEIKVSESRTLTEIGSIGFRFRDNGYCYLFIYLFIYLFVYLFIYLFIYLAFLCALCSSMVVLIGGHLPRHELQCN